MIAAVPLPLRLRASAWMYWHNAKVAYHRRERRLWLRKYCEVKQQMREMAQ